MNKECVSRLLFFLSSIATKHQQKWILRAASTRIHRKENFNEEECFLLGEMAKQRKKSENEKRTEEAKARF